MRPRTGTRLVCRGQENQAPDLGMKLLRQLDGTTEVEALRHAGDIGAATDNLTWIAIDAGKNNRHAREHWLPDSEFQGIVIDGDQ